MDKEALINVGLTPEEAEIYMSLIAKGAQSAAALAKNTSVKRTYVYRIASTLAQKGLVSIVKKGRATNFEANHPDNLLTLAQARQNEAVQAQNILEGVLPTLREKHASTETRPVVTYFEGKEGIKKVYRDTLSAEMEILALVETSHVEEEIYAWVTSEYVRMRVSKNISVKAIVSSGLKTDKYTELDKNELRETRVVPQKDYPFQNEINIYGDKVALIKHSKNSPLVGVIIDNQMIANTFRSWFNLTWARL